MIRGLLLRANGPMEEVYLPDENQLPSLYKYVECDCIDIVRRVINGTSYDITCDDEGALKGDRVVTAINSAAEPMFFGNLLITRNDGPELASLTDDDIASIKRAVIELRASEGLPGLSYRLLICEYC